MFTRSIIHFFRGLKFFRAAGLAINSRNLISDCFITCFSNLISVFHSFLPFLSPAVRIEQWPIVSIRTAINPLTVHSTFLMNSSTCLRTWAKEWAFHPSYIRQVALKVLIYRQLSPFYHLNMMEVFILERHSCLPCLENCPSLIGTS